MREASNWGVTTDTYDRLGQPTSEFRQPRFPPDRLRTVVDEMVGEQMQIPPPYSAKKIGGRAGPTGWPGGGSRLKIPPQRICIDQFKVRQGGADTIDFEVHCSPGTYVRSLAHELGQRLGCGAHLSRLRRLFSGKFSLSMACPAPPWSNAGRLDPVPAHHELHVGGSARRPHLCRRPGSLCPMEEHWGSEKPPCPMRPPP